LLDPIRGSGPLARSRVSSIQRLFNIFGSMPSTSRSLPSQTASASGSSLRNHKGKRGGVGFEHSFSSCMDWTGIADSLNFVRETNAEKAASQSDFFASGAKRCGAAFKTYIGWIGEHEISNGLAAFCFSHSRQRLGDAF